MRKKKYFIGKARRGKKRRDFPRFVIRHAQIISFGREKRRRDMFLYVDPYPEIMTLPEPPPSKVVSLDDYRQRINFNPNGVIHDIYWDEEGEFIRCVRDGIAEDTRVWRFEAEEIIYQWRLRKKKRWTRYKPILVFDSGYPLVALIDKRTGKRAPYSLLRFNKDVLACKRVDDEILSREEYEYDFDPDLPPSG